MSETKKKRDCALAGEEKTDKRVAAEIALLAHVNGAAVIEEYGKPFGEQGLVELSDVLKASIGRVQGGNTDDCEAMLIAQAHALQTIFMNFSRRALNQDYQKNLESFFRMALKAQNQCRMTLETLATIKNPPLVYAKQANIANGPQQINNGIAAPAKGNKTVNQPNELLEQQHGNYVDTGKAGATAGLDSAMATMGAINRAADGGGEGHRLKKRRDTRRTGG